MRHDDHDLELSDDDYLMLQDEPMKPIRLRYVTLTSERELLADTMERLGLAHAWVGHTLYALNECDTQRLTSDATAKLAAGGIDAPSAYQMARMTEAMLVEMVQAERVAKSVTPELVGQLLRAEADVELAARGVRIKANVAHAVAESEAA